MTSCSLTLTDVPHWNTQCLSAERQLFGSLNGVACWLLVLAFQIFNKFEVPINTEHCTCI